MLDDAGIKIEKNESGEYVSEYFSINSKKHGYYNSFLKENSKFKILVTMNNDVCIIREIEKITSVTPEVFVFDVLSGKMKIEKLETPENKLNNLLKTFEHCEKEIVCSECILNPCQYKEMFRYLHLQSYSKCLDKVEKTIKEYKEYMERKLKNEQ